MAIQKTEAFVLKTQPFRSSSLIITFFSRSFGKVRGVAKGVRREREMRGAHYELFTHLEIIFYEKTRSDLHLISESTILQTHDRLRTDLKNIAYASYFAELVDSLTELHDTHNNIFELLRFSFRFLPSLAGETLARLFEIKLLHEIGWLPYLGGCVACGTSPLETGYFSMGQGALFCANCSRRCPDAKFLHAEMLRILRYYIGHDLETSIRQRISPSTERTLEKWLEQFLLSRLGRPLKTRLFLREIQAVLA